MLRDRRVDPTHNFEATTSPAVTDDANSGYSVGSNWINTTTKELFVCFDATAGAAIWKEVGAGGGGGAYVETRDPNINDDASQGFDPGDFWLNTDNEVVFVCLDSTAGAASWRDVNQKDEYQIVYVGKHGDDAQSGKTPNKAKLTITAAITAAGTPPDDRNAVVVQIVDAGRYEETISLPDFVHLWGPNADFHGRILAGADVSISLRHHVGTGSDPALIRPSSANPGSLFYDVDELSNDGTGDLIHLLVEGVTTLRIRRMLSSHTKCVYMRDSGSGIPTAHFDVYELDCSDNIGIDAQDSRLHGRIDHIHGTTPTGKGIVLGSATVTSLTVNDLNAPTALDIATNAQADLFIGRITGTQVIANNAQARVSVARRDNLLATTDPTSSDTENDGYTNGSLWINNTTKDAFICVDQVVGTWVKIQLGTGGLTQTQIVYVGKHGSDARSGANIENAKLTFAAAIAAAGTPAGESTAVTVVCLDDGEYVENLTHVSYVNVYAPNASLFGLQALADNVSIRARRIVNDGTNLVISKSSGAGTATVDAEIIAQTAGVAAIAFGTSGSLRIRARYVECSAGGDGVFVQSTSAAKMYLDIDEFKGGGSGSEAVGAVAPSGLTTVAVYGRIGHLHSADVGILVGSFGGGAAYLNIDRLDCTTAYNIGAGGTLRLFVGNLLGTEIAADGASVRVSRSMHNNWTATTSPTVGDDSTDGYEVGSWWLNNSTDELYICVDASAAAAVWYEVSIGAGGGVHVATVDPTVNDDQTLGFDQGSLWLNTDNQTLWACVSSSVGAAVWRNTTDLAHLGKLLVGPVGFAPYQTIQPAITAATSGQTVYVLPGTYVENLTLKDGVSVRAIMPSTPWVPGLTILPVSIDGTLTWAPTSGFPSITLEGIDIDAPASQSAVVLNPGVGAGCILIVVSCDIRGADASSISLGTSGIAVAVACHRSALGRTYSSVSGASIVLSHSTHSLTLDDCQVYTPSGDPGIRTAVDISGGATLNVDNCDGANTLILGQINVSGGANNTLRVRKSYITAYGGASHVVVTGTLASGSYWHEVTAMASPSGIGGDDITVTGPNAATFIERPLTNAGSIRRYDGVRWKSVRNNYTAVASPTVNDDETQGYGVGSEWYDTASDIWWKCEDATTAAAVWEKGLGGGVDQIQVIYVGKHGSDAADGKTQDKAKLTVGAAITSAGTPASEALAVTICVVDDGEYAQDIILPSYVNLYAPSATIKGRTRINEAVHLRARRLIDNGTDSTLERLTAGTLPAFVDCDYIENLTGSSVMAFLATGTTYLRAGKTKHGAGIGVASTIFSGDTKVIVDIGEMECGASAALASWGNSTYKAELHGRVGKIIGVASSIGIDVAQEQSEAYLTIEEIDCTTAFQVVAAATNVLRLFVGQSSGTETIGAGASVRVTKTKRNNFGATVDPTVNDDTADGYDVGSLWINISSDEVFKCVDASAGAAIWWPMTPGKATNYPMGFPIQDDTYTTITWVDAPTPTFTITPVGPSFVVYIKGRKYEFTTPQVVTPTMAEGVWYIYFDSSGVLTASQTVWDLSQHAPVSLLYWDATSSQAIIFADERHGLVWPWQVHLQNHLVYGTRYQSGLGLAGTVGGSGNLDSDAQVSISNGNLWDEDIQIGIQDGASGRFTQELDPIANLPVFYLDGATPVWRADAATAFPLKQGTTFIQYNLFSGGSWSTAEGANGDVIASWVIGSDDYDEPIFVILGQRVDGSVTNARDNNTFESLSLPNLPVSEMKVLYRLLFETRNSYGNTPGARLVDIQDLRSVSNVPSGTFVATSHNSTSGRDVYPTHPGASINFTDRQQILYVGKHGSDAGAPYDGTDPEHAFLTIGAALTAAAALSPSSDATAVTIEIIDDGEYTEDITGVAWVNIYAPNARLVTATTNGHTIVDDERWVFGSMHATGTYAVQKSSTGYSYLKIGKLSRAGTSNRAIDITGGTLEIDIDYSTGTAGVAGAITTTDAAKIVGRVGFISTTSGTSACFLVFAQGTADADIDVTVERAESSTALWFGVAANTSTGSARLRTKFGTITGVATGFSSNNGGAGAVEIYAQGERLLPSTSLCSLTAGSKFRLIVGEASGTETIPNGADARITRASRDNYAATTDPTATDDSTDGYTVGSVWVNTSTDRVWICVDATATAAIWNVVPNGGEVQLQTVGAGITAAVTIPLIDPETVGLEVHVVARRTDSGTDHAAYVRRAAAYRNGGSAVQIGTTDTPFTRETDNQWDVTVTVSGNNLLVNVQGDTGQTVEWRVRYTLERM